MESSLALSTNETDDVTKIFLTLANGTSSEISSSAFSLNSIYMKNSNEIAEFFNLRIKNPNTPLIGFLNKK